ncbi:MAG TPA: U32 family peptidase [Bacteroidales bacterium]|nr:U32 family peptidase [Bacteroidales bacterium]
MTPIRSIELLAPAKNVECAREAILHGADAVYIGASKFGARSSAGNSLESLAELTEFAHEYGVRIYATINTILFDEELPEVEKLIWDLWRIGIDALIVQDMGIARLNLPPIPLHASTQTDNRTLEKIQFLQDAGFRQIVLARELSLDQIREIASNTSVQLECFVHGALCVSYSGQCYISQAISGRSANRGECAQFCRLPYDLIDADGRTIVRQKHLLSIKDLNRSEALEDLIDAGIHSFKIEGRLKDVSYVKNVTAYYRTKLDEILKKRPDLKRSSDGISHFTFQPNLSKSFNRGFTNYFLKGRPDHLGNLDTPKSMGEPVGRVKEIRGNHFSVAGLTQFANGDGLSFVGTNGQFEGFRVNRVEENRLFPARMPELTPNALLYRTHDQAFESKLEKPSAERKIQVTIKCWETVFGFALSMEDAKGNRVALSFEQEKVLASKPQELHVKNQLSKLGATLFEAISCDLDWSGDWFVPVSIWAEQRRLLCEKMMIARKIAFRKEEFRMPETNHSYPEKHLTYLGNVLNKKAAEFYQEHGVESIEPAFESKDRLRKSDEVLMFNKHCIKYELGACPRVTRSVKSLNEPLYLVYNTKRIQLRFDCKACEMQLIEVV